MKSIYILCHSISEKYIRGNLNAFVSELGRINGVLPVVRILERVDDFVCLDDSIVFVIGDPFKPFPRNEKCFYVFINFSIVSFLGRFKFGSLGGWKWIADKKKAFEKKLEQYDLIVDFYKPQTAVLRDKYKARIEVMNFLPNIHHEMLPGADLDTEKKYDLCVVGAVTPRRKRLYEKFVKLGAKLSPCVTDNLDEIIRASRFVLNVHAFDCNTAELPRIVHALKAGVPLITERCYELAQLIPGDCYAEGSYRELTDIYLALKDEPQNALGMVHRATDYMTSSYDALSLSAWKTVLEKILLKAPEKSYETALLSR